MNQPSSPPPRGPLISADDALARLLGAVQPLARTENVSTPDAWGRVLAQDVVSPVNVPPEDNSAMDGYAIRLADLAGGAGALLPVSQRIVAGRPGRPLAAGTAARIFTGAQVPSGADAVVMQEHCEAVPSTRTDDPFGGVRINELPVPGMAIRRQGEDVMKGHAVLRAGHRMDAAAIGLAATVGMARLDVAARPRVALFSTGDELVMPGEPLPPGAIYNSNRFMLGALLRGQGCIVTDLGNVPDQLEATRAMLREAAAGHDLILSSGGVSVGEEDHLKPALAAEGRLDLWAIAIKPGKPLAFGAVRRAPAAAALGRSGARPQQPLGGDPRISAPVDAVRSGSAAAALGRSGARPQQPLGGDPRISAPVDAVRSGSAAAALGRSGARPQQPLGGDPRISAGGADISETWFIGLPGNPVSSHVTFTLFVRPVLARLQGAPAGMPAAVAMRADFAWPKPDKRREFLRVKRNASGGLDLYRNQGSGVLTSLAWGDGLADIAPGQAVQPGDLVRYLSLAELAP